MFQIGDVQKSDIAEKKAAKAKARAVAQYRKEFQRETRQIELATLDPDVFGKTICPFFF